MGAQTYKTRAIVLKKTKLAEKDLIVTMLAEDGSLAQGVAKGARRPGGSLAARLELFSTCDLMLAKGRSLDIVSDARRVDAVSGFDWGLERSACAAPVAELLAAVAQPDLEQPRLFDMARAAFLRVGSVDVPLDSALAVAAAALWKVMSQVGYRPSFSNCVRCANAVPFAEQGESASGNARVALSVLDGGIVCDSCPRPADALVVETNDLRWCESFIRARFDEIVSWNVPSAVSYATMEIARQWARVHTGKNIKSLDFLFTL